MKFVTFECDVCKDTFDVSAHWFLNSKLYCPNDCNGRMKLRVVKDDEAEP